MKKHTTLKVKKQTCVSNKSTRRGRTQVVYFIIQKTGREDGLRAFQKAKSKNKHTPATKILQNSANTNEVNKRVNLTGGEQETWKTICLIQNNTPGQVTTSKGGQLAG